MIENHKSVVRAGSIIAAPSMLSVATAIADRATCTKFDHIDS
jgi:hypothetical protein